MTDPLSSLDPAAPAASGATAAIPPPTADVVKPADGARQALLLTLANYLVLGAGLITGPLMGRALGDVGRGHVAQVDTLLQFGGYLFGLGLTTSFAQAIATRRETAERLLGAARRLAVRAIPVAVLVLPVLALPKLQELPSGPRVVAAVGILLLPTWTLSLGALGIVTGRGDLRSLSVMRVAPILINLGLVTVMFATGTLTATTALAAMVVVAPLNAWLAAHFAGGRTAPGADLPPLVRFGAKSMGGQLTQLANLRLDQLLIQPLLSYAALGRYAVAASAAAMPVAVSQAMYARAMRVVGGEEGRWDPVAAERLLRQSVLVSVLAAAATAAVSPLVPLLYGPDFRGSVVPLLLLLPGTVGLALTAPTAMIMAFLDRPGLSSLFQVVGLVVTLVGLVVMVPLLGINGAAIVSSASYLTAAVLGLGFLRRHGVRRVLPGPRDAVDVTRALRRALARHA